MNALRWAFEVMLLFLSFPSLTRADSWLSEPSCGSAGLLDDPEFTYLCNRTERIDPIVVLYEDSISIGDSAYMSALARDVMPYILEVLGPPHGLDTLKVRIWDRDRFDADASVMTMTPIPIDHDTVTGELPQSSIDWDNTFVHELTHAFCRELGYDDPMWFTEGIAEATRYFVAEAMAKAGVRRAMLDPRTATHMAITDIYDEGGIALSGGTYWYPDRANGEACYRGAAAAILLPCFAEIAAGCDTPHPLRRFTDAIIHEKTNRDWYSYRHAADSVWTSPVDGVYPPSRWLQSRSVVWGGDPPDGVYLAVLPDSPNTPVNPSNLQLFAYRRHLGFDCRIVPGRMIFTGAGGGRWESVSAGGFSPVPDLPPGAYLVEAEAETEWSESPTVRGRNWIIVTPTGRPLLESSEGMAVIFADSSGSIVDVPDISANGRVVERVPGGIVVAPYASAGEATMLTLRSGERALGSVTVPGRYSRTVVMRVNGAIRTAAVSWTPYQPSEGDSLTVYLRRSDTTLDPLASEVSFLLVEPGDANPARRSMRRAEGTEDLWVGRAPMPVGVQSASLHFTAGNTRFGTWDWGRHEVRPLPLGGCSISGVECALGGIILTFDGTPDAQKLLLQFPALDEVDAWSDSPNRPTQVSGDPSRLRFELCGTEGLIRIIHREAETDRILMTLRVSPNAERNWISVGNPFPNPARGGLRWAVEASAPVLSELRIYDLSGRLVVGPIEQRLVQGPQEVRWNGTTRDPLSAGVYFLKLTGGERDAIRKIIMLPGRSN